MPAIIPEYFYFATRLPSNAHASKTAAYTSYMLERIIATLQIMDNSDAFELHSHLLHMAAIGLAYRRYLHLHSYSQKSKEKNFYYYEFDTVDYNLGKVRNLKNYLFQLQ